MKLVNMVGEDPPALGRLFAGPINSTTVGRTRQVAKKKRGRANKGEMLTRRTTQSASRNSAALPRLPSCRQAEGEKKKKRTRAPNKQNPAYFPGDWNAPEVLWPVMRIQPRALDKTIPNERSSTRLKGGTTGHPTS